MKAIRIHQYGAPETLRYEDAPLPTPQAGQILIRVHAAGVNPVDSNTRAGRGIAGMLPKDVFPLILGWDVAGVVTEAAPDSRFAVGDAVYGMVSFPKVGSAYAEYVAADEQDVAKIPAGIAMTTAASLPLVALTAWQALFDTGNLQAGQRVLIHGAAGGVGHIAVQLAKWCGAYVIGTASARNQAYLKELGVDETIDYTAERFEDKVSEVDLVLNTVDPETAGRSFAVVKRGGALVTIAGKPDTTPEGIHAAQILVKPSAEQLEKIAELMVSGKLKPTIERVFPLTRTAEAHELIATGHVRGKIVLQVVE